MFLPVNKEVYCVDEKFVSNPGERYRPVYTSEIMDDGTIELVQTGVEDLQEIYNSQRNSCDVNLIAQQFIAGDLSVLNRANPVFLDLLGAPKSLMEAYQMQHRAEQAFNLLPVDVREHFNHSFSEFLAGAGTPEWFDALKISKDSVDIKEVETSES